uniref:BTB domain-containing protein n=1 Tax=Oryza brachyantha TaxID=4533 RepID=J3LEP6_ORYBR
MKGSGRVRINVGGRVFETTASTLASAGRDTMLGAMLDASWNRGGEGGGEGGVEEYFIDRDPECFAVLLDLLRTGALHVPPHVDDGVLCREALYYGVLDRVRAARWGPSFTPGALAFDQRCKIFASCKGRFNEYGIGVWDCITGEQADFFYEPPGCALGDADKLQWLDGTNTLMVATMFPRTDSSFISLLDFRDRNVAWSWSDVGTPASLEDKHVLHAIAMEDGRSLCVINQYDDLGFLDIRSNAAGVRWRSRSKLTTRKKKAPHGEETCYPKLAAHGGQIFASTNDTISVFSGPDHVLTSTLRGSDAGAICDFSIGGDRLFALHDEENVVDVWETSPPPVI